MKDNSKCPECGQAMVSMGKRWKPPRRTQDRKWKQQEQLWRDGYRPDGTVGHLQSEYSICRWCGERDDDEHRATMQAARHPRWYMIKHRGYYYISKGKKR